MHFTEHPGLTEHPPQGTRGPREVWASSTITMGSRSCFCSVLISSHFELNGGRVNDLTVLSTRHAVRTLDPKSCVRGGLHNGWAIPATGTLRAEDIWEEL
jgi:hypothetical protein